MNKKELRHTNWEAVAEYARKSKETIEQQSTVTREEAKAQVEKLHELTI